ncbi:PD-(D/E)XK nuclease family protein, partial [Patescibacteria group bacterium]|nr:PD-(D/E)XK nuclease family protein [Patescibacteria group bacterium]
MPDKYSALWLSHSSISDYLACPRAYYLKNIYKDPKTNHKIQLMSPPLALGQAVHQVLESLSVLPSSKRFTHPLMEKFHQAWQKVSGLNGGFFDLATENKYKDRGQAIIQRVIDHPGPLGKLAVKIDEDLPYYYISEADNIILCGKVDWLEYLPDDNS